MPPPKLFQPIQVGDVTLAHRVVLAPLTRCRANVAHIHEDMAVEYYAQRASVPGALLISEATLVSAKAGGRANVPGIWNAEQIAAWKRITDAVHAKGSFIYVQIRALGRAAQPAELEKEDPSFPFVSASDIPLKISPKAPRPLTIPEIKEYVEMFATAASNAVHGAGFDGVEIHGANGYLVDQFLQDTTNRRTDEYGGSIENRSRFPLEVVDAVVKAVGERKTAIRLSPWSNFQEMRMDDPVPTFRHIIEQLAERYSNLAFLHLVEPSAAGNNDRIVMDGESNDTFRQIWAPRILITAGGYTRETALEVAESKGDLIAFGKAYIANPDLPLRLLKNIPLAKEERWTHYATESAAGYIDFPFATDPSEFSSALVQAY